MAQGNVGHSGAQLVEGMKMKAACVLNGHLLLCHKEPLN